MRTLNGHKAGEELIIKQVLIKSAAWLDGKGSPSSRLDAELLLGHILGLSRLDLYLAWDRPLSEDEKVAYRQLLQRRAAFEPVAYITGEKEFFSLTIKVCPDVLIPRPETEFLVEQALELAASLRSESSGSDPLRIADVGTGSGAVALALADRLPEAEIVATDLSVSALAVASENARLLGLSERLDFRHVSLLDDIDLSFDLVVSNPPYIKEGDRETLMSDVVDYEPHEALFAGEDGLCVFRALIVAASERLCSGGWLVMEVGSSEQAAEVQQLLELQNTFDPASFCKDYSGVDRVVFARRVA